MKQEEKQMRQYLRQIGRQLEVTGTLRERILSDLENDIRAGLLLSAAALVIFVLWSLLAGQLLPGMAGQKRRNAAALILAVLAVATALGGGILGWLSPDGIGLYLAGGVQNLWFWAGAAGALLVALGALVFVIAKMMSRKK